MSVLLLTVALTAYLAGTLDATIVVLGGPRRLRGIAPTLVAIGVVAHGVHLVREGIEAGGSPLGGLGGYVSVLGAAIALLYLAVWLRWRMDALALVLIPLSAVAVSIAIRLESMQVIAGPPPRGWLLIHTSLVTAGMALLGVAAAMSTLYLIQDGALKAARTLAVLEKLPTLARCDRLGFQALIAGFATFTLGIFTGVFLNIDLHAAYMQIESKQTLSLVAWSIFAGVVLLRVTAGFRGRRAAVLVIAGFLAGLAAVVGIAV